MIAEEWRQIPSWPDYCASSLGRIASTKRGGWHVMRTNVHSTGYRNLALCMGGRQRTRTVHMLVAEAFHGPRPEGLQVRHLDGDRQNNAAANLQYGTPSENCLDKVRHGRHPHANRTHCPSGHPYSPENTRMNAGKRACLTCRRAQSIASKARRALRDAGVDAWVAAEMIGVAR